MTRVVGLVIAVFALSGAAATADPTPAERLAAIKKAVSDAEAELRKAAAGLGEGKEDVRKTNELYKAFSKAQEEGFARAAEVAKADPTSDAGFDAIEWLLTTPRAHYLPPGVTAMQLAAEHHAVNPRIGKSVARLGSRVLHEGFNPKELAAATALIRAVAEKNPDRAVRGQAVFALALQAKGLFDVAEYEARPDADRLAAEAERQFESVLREYTDGDRMLGDATRHNLFELRNLRVGKRAPEVAGEDLDGKPFELGDHRGKVVLIVFWASWCGPCMADVPHEKELAEKFNGRPFAIVGVNGDHDRVSARKVVTKTGISWRSFWNGKEGPGGPIASTWNVRGWPTTYVLDHAGVIRHKNITGDRLDAPLAKLVKEAEAALEK